MSQPAQISLFDLLGAAPPIDAAAPVPAEAVHYLIVTTRRAGTPCGIVTWGISNDSAINAETGDRFLCTNDRYSGKVTCPRCKEAMW